MIPGGLFTKSDVATILKASAVAERLTESFFELKPDEWKRNPYSLFTLKEIGHSLHEEGVFANVIRYPVRPGKSEKPAKERYGIVLQDPNILSALLRRCNLDLWSLILFVLTHELVHICRFDRFGADFFAGENDRDKEEELVHNITREILSGADNTEKILRLYSKRLEGEAFEGHYAEVI
jgi:hypothetical protein